MAFAGSLQGNQETTQAGHGIAFGNALVYVAQLTIETAQLLSLLMVQPILEILAEKGNAIVGPPCDLQKAAALTKEWAGALIIRRRWLFAVYQKRQQVGEGQMMPTAAATMIGTCSADFRAPGRAGQGIQLDLEFLNSLDPLHERVTGTLIQGGQFVSQRRQQQVPIKRRLGVINHGGVEARHPMLGAMVNFSFFKLTFEAVRSAHYDAVCQQSAVAAFYRKPPGMSNQTRKGIITGFSPAVDAPAIRTGSDGIQGAAGFHKRPIPDWSPIPCLSHG